MKAKIKLFRELDCKVLGPPFGQTFPNKQSFPGLLYLAGTALFLFNEMQIVGRVFCNFTAGTGTDKLKFGDSSEFFDREPSVRTLQMAGLIFLLRFG